MVVSRTFHQILESDLRARYFRAKFEGTHSNTPPASDAPAQQPQFHDIEGAIAIRNDSQTIAFPPAGFCIYCGATEYAPGETRSLGEEHIISEGMGGTIIFPEASCKQCEGCTSSAETSVLGNTFWAVRHSLKLRMKRSKIRRTRFPVVTSVNGRDVRFSLPLHQHPTMIFMLSLARPGILSGRPIDTPGIRGVWLHELNSISRADHPIVMSPSIDTVKFCQFIAKIGHSLAVATLGVVSFDPLLTDFIRRKFGKSEQHPECYHLIGGTPDTAPSTSLHEVGIGFGMVKDQWYVIVDVRLFGNLGAPNYNAVVGRLKPGITPQDALARAAIPVTTPTAPE